MKSQEEQGFDKALKTTRVRTGGYCWSTADCRVRTTVPWS